MTSADKPDRLRPLANVINALDAVLDAGLAEEEILRRGSALLGGLVARDDWLPDAYAVPGPDRYRQYLLHRDGRARFSMVSFVWGPGQATPIHDHTVWGLVGVLRGAERSQRYRREPDGRLTAVATPECLEAGAVEAVSPRFGDIHRVANAYDDRVSVSIHLYGADIGTVERSTYDVSGAAKRFVSGYAPLPPLIP